MNLFVNWLGRWSKIAELVEEHRRLASRPILNEKRLRQIEYAVGALVVTALGRHGNSPCRWED